MGPTSLLFALLLTPTQTPTPEAQRLAALEADPSISCYAVAFDRPSVPVRENYFTYSPIVASIPRGKVFLGQRVVGENKVLVMSPNAPMEIGIARFTFTEVVARDQCKGKALYQPRYDELLVWSPPFDGLTPAPSPKPPAQLLTSWGCFEAPKATRLASADETTVPAGQAFFAERPLVGNHYSTTLSVLDAKSGEALGTVSERKVKQVPLSRCGAALAR
ncbi:MAG: hypothetical protein JNJ59_14845 [Deltaproteobacteria bacterium]|nr:hypothetical protein [Deltaproteobacteria bacterium]